MKQRHGEEDRPNSFRHTTRELVEEWSNQIDGFNKPAINLHGWPFVKCLLLITL